MLLEDNAANCELVKFEHFKCNHFLHISQKIAGTAELKRLLHFLQESTKSILSCYISSNRDVCCNYLMVNDFVSHQVTFFCYDNGVAVLIPS